MSTLSERAQIRKQRRQDPNEAAAVLARVCPDEPVRRSLEYVMAASIELAHQAGPAAWEVTLNYYVPFVRLNVGSILAFSVEPRGAYVALTPEPLPTGVEGQLKTLQLSSSPFKVVDLRLVGFRPEDVSRIWESIRDSHAAAIRVAASAYERSPYSRSHSPGVVDHLKAVVGRDLPSPTYSGNARSVQDLVQLMEKRYPSWAGFDDPRFVEDERTYKVKTIERSAQLLSKPGLQELLVAGRFDEFIERLRTVGSDNNLLYTRIPSAGDLSVLYAPEIDKPGFCRAVFELIHGDGDSPDRFAAYLKWIEDRHLPSKWTFPTYFLWVCAPGSEIYVKPGSTQTALKLIGSELKLGQPNAAAYSEYRDLAAELKEDLKEYGPRDLTDIQGFLWVAAEAAKAAAGRCWKIAPGEKAKLWDEWLADGVASIGWSELGDISGLTRAEFDERREKLQAEHPDWAAAGINQVWRFSQIEVGDRIIANRGVSRVLGVGTVTGGYHFVAGREHCHLLAVEWTDTTQRDVNEANWRKTLLRLDPEEEARVLKAPVSATVWAPESPEPPPPAVPVAGAAFSPAAFDLLSQLKKTPTRDFYLSRKSDFVREVEEPFQRLFRSVVEQLPPAVREHMETERNVFSRILKNDWGRGGAWPHYWGALYPKTGRRIEDAQLFVGITAEKLEWGFYVGEYGSEKGATFRAHAAKRQALLDGIFEGYRGRALQFHGEDTSSAGEAVGSAAAWRRWTLGGPNEQIGAKVAMQPTEVLTLNAAALSKEIVRTFADLFPLVYFTESSDPTLLVRKYLGDDEGPDDTPAEPLQPPYPITKMAEDCAFDEAQLQHWVSAVERKGQAILYGPPGTGKTFVAQALAKHIVGGEDGFVELVQFHPSYAYEDFILGIRPKTLPNGSLTYENAKGRFIEFCERAQERTGKCVLIIDEINRANLSRVFGELMYLLEYRKGDVPLAGGVRFAIPQNVHLIGTMNTADRSIALVDHALRRRFAFLRLQPNYDVLTRYHQGRGGAFQVDKLVSVLKALNGAINNSHYEVGISFFLNPKLGEHIEHIWRMEIEPYLEEYFFDQESKVNEYRWDKVRERLGIGN
jgi:5-methylcytosine-specific restriction enzyme B